MNAKYLEDIWPKPFTILGKRLLPLSIGRILLLDRFDCAPVESIGALVLAIIICSRPCREVFSAIEDPWLNLKIRVWRWRLGAVNYAEKLLLWREYLTAHTRRPETTHNAGSPIMPGAPALQSMRIVLRSHCNWTQEEIEEASYTQAAWDYYSYWEVEGKLLIRQETDELSPDGIAAMRASANELHEERLRKAKEMAGL